MFLLLSYRYWAYWVVPQITHPPFSSLSDFEVHCTPSSPLVAHQFQQLVQGKAISSLSSFPLLGAYHQLLALLALQFHHLRCPLWTRVPVGGPLDSFQAKQVSSILLIISKFTPDTIDIIKPIDYLHCTSVKWGTIWCLASHWWL